MRAAGIYMRKNLRAEHPQPAFINSVAAASACAIALAENTMPIYSYAK